MVWNYSEKEKINEILDRQENPFIIKFIAIREGFNRQSGNNKRFYSASAIKSLENKIIGKEMFLGHIKEDDRPYLYRTPIAKIFGYEIRTINQDDLKENKDLSEKDLNKYACFCKAYLSENACSIKKSIQELMTNAVSIDGKVSMYFDGKNYIVDEFVTLYSIDICNNFTEGVEGSKIIKWLEFKKDNSNNSDEKYFIDLEINLLKGTRVLDCENSDDKRKNIIRQKIKEKQIKEMYADKIIDRVLNSKKNLNIAIDDEIELLKRITNNKCCFLKFEDCVVKN